MEPGRIAEDQARALVRGEAPGEADRQRPGIEQRPERDGLTGIGVARGPSLPDSIAQEAKKAGLEPPPDLPERLVRDRRHALP